VVEPQQMLYALLVESVVEPQQMLYALPAEIEFGAFSFKI